MIFSDRLALLLPAKAAVIRHDCVVSLLCCNCCKFVVTLGVSCRFEKAECFRSASKVTLSKDNSCSEPDIALVFVLSLDLPFIATRS